jgi:predicted dehydrogenase
MRDFFQLEDDATYEDYEPLVSRDDVDVVDVCTPPNFRGPIVLAAAANGKHVIAEKPLATVPEVGAAMVAAARRAGVKLGVVHNWLYLPHFRAMFDAVDRGLVGDVEVALITNLGNADFAGEADYDPRWRHRADTAGGGVLMDLLHHVYVGERLIGMPIERVSGWTRKEAASDVERLALCRFEADGAAALVNVAWGVGPNRIDVSGSLGKIASTLVAELPGDGEVVVEAGGSRQHSTHALRESTVVEAFTAVLEDFADAVLTGGDPVTPGETSQRILEAVFATYESAVTGRTVELPLDPDDPVFRQGLTGLNQLGSIAHSAASPD